MAYRESFPDDELPIEPRLEPASLPEPGPNPEPTPRQIAARGMAEQDGFSQSDVLLQAIVIAARHEPPNRGALRSLIAKFSCECGLDF